MIYLGTLRGLRCWCGGRYGVYILVCGFFGLGRLDLVGGRFTVSGRLDFISSRLRVLNFVLRVGS